MESALSARESVRSQMSRGLTCRAGRVSVRERPFVTEANDPLMGPRHANGTEDQQWLLRARGTSDEDRP